MAFKMKVNVKTKVAFDKKKWKIDNLQLLPFFIKYSNEMTVAFLERWRFIRIWEGRGAHKLPYG